MATLRRIAIYLVAAIIGIALGLASAVYFAGLWPGAKPLDFGDVSIDGWNSDFAIGSEAADPYTRARIARHGLLALAKSEAVYFTRTVDDEGERLTEDCRYRLTVGAMPAEWWSITLYDANSMLPMNDDGPLSINANQDAVAVLPDGEVLGQGVQAIIAPERPDSPSLWLSSRNAGTFDLTLRLYVPEDTLLTSPEETLDAPSVQRIDCAPKVSE
ncbi:MAG: DUF1214 domain-containing protein [Pseudomonadota bacterium]